MEKKINVLFRADSSEVIGYGHVMRCLALALKLQRLNCNILFLCREIHESLSKKLSLNNIELKTLADNSISELVSSVQSCEAHIIIFDGYPFVKNYMSRVIELLPSLFIGSIDDHFSSLGVDFIINQNIYATRSKYEDGSADHIFTGLDYALLRDEFYQPVVMGKNNTKNKRILVTCGGSDPNNLNEIIYSNFLSLFEESPEKFSYEIKFVVTSSKPSLLLFSDVIKKSPFSCDLVVDSTSMSGLMKWADIAISGGGSTVLELVEMNIPSLLISIAENQEMNIEYMVRKKYSVFWGAIGELNYESFRENLLKLIKKETVIINKLQKIKVGHSKVERELLRIYKERNNEL